MDQLEGRAVLKAIRRADLHCLCIRVPVRPEALGLVLRFSELVIELTHFICICLAVPIPHICLNVVNVVSDCFPVNEGLRITKLSNAFRKLVRQSCISEARQSLATLWGVRKPFHGVLLHSSS